MKRLMQITMTAALVALAVSPALAQEQQQQQDGGGLGFGKILLYTQKSVQQELKLSDEQLKKVTELREKQRANFPDFRKLSREEMRQKLAERTKVEDEAIAKILNAEQCKRAKQIALQWDMKQLGIGFALNKKEIAKALQITDEQKEKLREIRTKAREDSRGLGFDEEGRKKSEEIRKAANKKVEGVLSAEQKSKLKELQGEPFKGKIAFPQFGGRRNRQN